MAFVRYAGDGNAAGVPTEYDGYSAMKVAQEIQQIIRGRQ
jgi:hypothetical protein